ncbi:MAG: ABC transporter ATP-binding protein [Betaproteobacteria bacterium]|nr:ABC transporter ATP-binding protein [Betaproteobacteria bacterium]
MDASIQSPIPVTCDGNLVEIRDLHFAYGKHTIFRGINLDLPREKVVAILGPSGCGKSTLLGLIGGQLKPARGTVTVCGRNVHALETEDLYALRREMGMMFQQGGLFSDLTVFENIAFPLREHTKLPEDIIRDIVLMKLNAVGLRGAHPMRTGDLSGGMSRRVALARAIAMDPQLIMYDEPFAGLDPISLNVVAHLIRTLNDALNASSIIVTYDVPEAMKSAEYVYLINEGVVAAEGTPESLRASTDPFVVQFLNAQPDGPVGFHWPAPPIEKDLRLAS